MTLMSKLVGRAIALAITLGTVGVGVAEASAGHGQHPPAKPCIHVHVVRPGFVWVCDHWERQKAPPPAPVVRDHRTPPAPPVVRDHRTPPPPPVVRDHRTKSSATSTAQRKCYRVIVPGIGSQRVCL